MYRVLPSLFKNSLTPTRIDYVFNIHTNYNMFKLGFKKEKNSNEKLVQRLFTQNSFKTFKCYIIALHLPSIKLQQAAFNKETNLNNV